MTIAMTKQYFNELRNSYAGICLSCEGETWGNVEPDAENYVCECCGERQVFGVEYLIFSDDIRIVSEEELERIKRPLRLAVKE